MKTTQITGKLLHLIYSPKGTIEGLLLDVSGKNVQIVCPPTLGSLLGAEPQEGLPITATVEAGGAGPLHKVHALVELKKIGNRTVKNAAQPGKVVSTKGTVARLNYARHGQPNGVVLDSGDFIHTRPDNMEMLGLKPGDAVVAHGEAAAMASGGRVFEASKVNGVTLAKKAAKKAGKKAAKKAPAKKAAKSR